MTTLKLKTLKKSDNITIIFGEWFDRINGNTYHDTTIRINNLTFYKPWEYGYDAGSIQTIDQGLLFAGYKLRKNTKDRFRAYDAIHTVKTTKLKRELNK